MIPLRDNVKTSRPAIVNYVLIAVTTGVFGLQLAGGGDGHELVERYGMIPQRVFNPEASVVVDGVVHHRELGPVRVQRIAEPSAVPPWLTLLTCIFLHGGVLHFLGNMWFLFIFGDNVEDRLGHFGYSFFYLASGVAASAVHLLTNASSPVPTIGASGAIAGVMGAYFVLYPRATVLTLIPIFFYVDIVVLPAFVFLGIWFLLQLFQGALSSGAAGVAWWAHIGGFVVGVGFAFLLRRIHRLRSPAQQVIPRTDRMGRYRRYEPWRRRQ